MSSLPISPQDSTAAMEKAHEVGLEHGAVILEIGGAGTAHGAAALRGARMGVAAGRVRGVPQLYRVEVAQREIVESAAAMREMGLGEQSLFFAGSAGGLGAFWRQVPIVPTMVVMHGGGGFAEDWGRLKLLSDKVGAGVPVMCVEGVDGRAVEEWIAAGRYAERDAGGSLRVLTATEQCRGVAWGLPAETFGVVREALLRSYQEAEGKGTHAAGRRIGEATGPAREAALDAAKARGSYAARGWPYEAKTGDGFPGSLPDGTPWPKISIVTPSFNYGRFLEETILSVLHQGYPHVEHLVLDGGSTDSSAAIIEKYRHVLAYGVSERDRGQSDAINKGFARATGEIFTWLNADDMLAPGALHAMALAFWHSKADVVAGVCERYRDGRLLEKHITCCANGPLPLGELLDVEGSWMAGQFFTQPEVMFTRAMWEKAGGRVEEALTYSMDYEMWLRFALAGAKLHVIGRSIALFRHHGEQKTAVAKHFMPELLGVRDGFVAKHGVEVMKRAVMERPRYRVRVASVHGVGLRSGVGVGQTRVEEALCLAGHEVHRLETGSEGTGEMDAGVVVKGIAGVAPDLVMVGTPGGAGVTKEAVAGCVERWPTCVVMHDGWGMGDGATVREGIGAREIREGWEGVYGSFGEGKGPVMMANSEWMRVFVEEALATARGHADERAQEAQVCELRRPVAPGVDYQQGAVFAIRYGVDLGAFRPLPKWWCRRELGLPEDRFLILTTATALDDSSGGIRLLAEAVKRLMLPEVMVVCLGEADAGMREAFPGLRSLGGIADARRRAMAYGAVDVVAGMGREEAYGFGQRLTEAAACGTPSVGFAVGATREAVINGVTGALAATVSAEALAWEIYGFYREGARGWAMGKWGRLFAENEWSPAMAYQRLHAALRVSGVLERLGMPPKISLVPEPSLLLEPVGLGLREGEWQPVSGFAPWEGPYPEQGLPRCRWLTGGVSVLRVAVTHPGVHRVRVACGTFHPHAVLRVVHEGVLRGEMVVAPFAAGAEPSVLSCEVELKGWEGMVELHHWPWDVAGGERGNSVLLFELAVTGPEGREVAEKSVDGERRVAAALKGGGHAG